MLIYISLRSIEKREMLAQIKPPRITSLLYGHSPIADTALTCTTYDAEVTRLRNVTLSVVAVIGPC